MEKYPVVGSYTRLFEMSMDPEYNSQVREAARKTMRTLWRFMEPGEKAEAIRRKDLLDEQKRRPGNGSVPQNNRKPRIWIG